jgi:hypothetical protein
MTLLRVGVGVGEELPIPDIPVLPGPFRGLAVGLLFGGGEKKS